MYWRGKCRIGFRFVFDKNNEFHSRTAMDQRVNIINVASTQIQIYSLDGPTYSGGFKLKKHEKSLVGLPVWVHWEQTRWEKKNSVSVSKLNQNVIKNGETICFKSKIRNLCRRTMVNRCLVVLVEFNGKTPWHWQSKYSLSG